MQHQEKISWLSQQLQDRIDLIDRMNRKIKRTEEHRYSIWRNCGFGPPYAYSFVPDRDVFSLKRLELVSEKCKQRLTRAIDQLSLMERSKIRQERVIAKATQQKDDILKALTKLLGDPGITPENTVPTDPAQGQEGYGTVG